MGGGENLTDRELTVLRLLSEGNSDDEVAKLTFCSCATVKRLAASAFSKLGARNRAHAVLIGCTKGIIPMPLDYQI